MNLSTGSVYDNVKAPDCLSKSSEYRTIKDLCKINTDIEVRLYCPLCVKCFDFKLSLLEHLKTFHNNFLIQNINKTMEFKECVFCCAKFYGKHLTVRHALLHHSKAIKGVFAQENKCYFCDFKLYNKEIISFVKHIEDNHFLDFEEEFGKIFSWDNTLEMTIFKIINSSVISDSSVNFEDNCVDVGKSNLDLNNQDFEESSKINCFDFTDLKQQLDNMKLRLPPALNSEKKSILKNITNSSTTQKSVKRVLRFDIQSNDEDKESSILAQNLKTFRQISIDEHSLLCNESKIDKFLKFNDSFIEEPQHSSTPNKIMSKNKIKPVSYKPAFKSYISDKKIHEYEFQCGKCTAVFKENLDLLFHVKKNHKKFNLNAFQPCYKCAICSAKFYKNYYLRKHHSLHKPY